MIDMIKLENLLLLDDLFNNKTIVINNSTQEKIFSGLGRNPDFEIVNNAYVKEMRYNDKLNTYVIEVIYINN